MMSTGLRGRKRLLYFNEHFDMKVCTENNMAQFETAVRYLGPPVSVTKVTTADFEPYIDEHDERKPVPVGVAYACAVSSEDRNKYVTADRNPWGNSYGDRNHRYVRMEFIVPFNDELKNYLSDMERRYYTWRDAEEKGWRL